jgi:type I restriction enzyme S subunit
MMTGTAGQKRVPSDYFATRAFPLPPSEEQSRIVAKVDELMALCDQLERQQQDRRKMQNSLRKSTLQVFAGVQSPHELQENWHRLQANFWCLFKEPEDVEALRGLILDLAILGRLTEAQPGDEPAEMLLKRTRVVKAHRLAVGEMKRKVAAATEVVQLEVRLPDHWTRASFDELFQFIDYRGKTPTKTDSGVVLVTAKNVRPGRLEREPIEHISEQSYSEWMTRGFPKTGDILFTTEAPLGNVALIEFQPSFALAQRVINLQPFADLNTRCAMYFMMAPSFQALLDKNSSGMTAKGIKAGKLKQLDLPLPPLSEQARIVARVGQLLKLCDDLELQLRDSERFANRLAATAVASLTGINTEDNEANSVKPPQTELIAQLHLASPPDVKVQAPLATILARHQGELAARDLWQRFGGEIDAFYAQLKTEVAHGWIAEPGGAQVREKQAAKEAKV